MALLIHKRNSRPNISLDNIIKNALNNRRTITFTTFMFHVVYIVMQSKMFASRCQVSMKHPGLS